jgi:predicted metal-dependent phosphoesterase TrpH
VRRVKAHQEADNIIQGQGWSEGKGCAVGCTLENYAHSQYPIELGLPEWLAHLQDAIFEGLPRAEAKAFPLQFLEAIPVGVYLEAVRHKLAVLRLSSLLVNLNGGNVKVKDAINQVIEYHKAALEGTLNNEELEGLRAAAESAAESAPGYAARSAPGYAARSAAWSAAESAAESAPGYAARSAAWSAAESAAESAAWKIERDNLLVTLRGLE